MSVTERSTRAEARRHRWPFYVLAGLVVAGALAWSTTRVADALADTLARESPVETGQPTVGTLLERAERAERAWVQVERYYDQKIAPIERVLLQYRDDPPLVRRIALALVQNAQEVGLEPRLLLAVLLVENPWLDPEIRSPVGAVGLMQVMPQHRGNWEPCRDDLESVASNVCHGARIFAHYFRQQNGDVEKALLRYNGCVRGTNTPDCDQYPYHVYARAGRASILAWLRPRPARAASP